MIRRPSTLAHAITVAILIVTGSKLSLAASTDTLVYDRPTGKLCWLEKKVKVEGKWKGMSKEERKLALSGACPPGFLWDRNNDFFRTGSVVRMLITRHRFLSTFKVDLDTRKIQPDLPAYRGLSGVEPAGGDEADTVAKKGGSAVDAVTDSSLRGANYKDLLSKWLAALQTAYREADSKLAQLSGVETSLLGQVTKSPPPLPGFQLRRIKSYADKMAKVTADPKQPYTDQKTFIQNVESTDLLIQGVGQFNRQPSLKESFEAKDAWDTFVATGQAVDANLATAAAFRSRTSVTATSEEAALEAQIRDYLPSGGKLYKNLNDKARNVLEISDLIRQVNQRLLAIFDNINSAYLVSESPEPYEVFLNQWKEGSTVEWRLQETPSFIPYGFSEGISSRTGQATSSAAKGVGPKANPFAATAGAAKTASEGNATGGNTPSNGSGANGKGEDTGESAQTGPEERLVARGNFDVHQTFRANVVSGFVYSFLDEREYGVGEVRAVDASGAPLSKDGVSIYNKVPTIGEARRPQIHYFVGVNFYLRPRDVYPGRLKRADFWTPGLLFAYGVNEPLNFFIGPNWETKWGLNLGLGLHFGRETFLAPGVVPYLPDRPAGSETRLADDATAPPVVKRTRQHLYLSAGFDVSVFKGIWGKLAGLGAPKD